MNTDDIIHKIGNSTEILEFGTTPARAFMLIGHLQLALRHPSNTGASAAFARQMADNLTDAICHYIPEARELIEQGWHPGYDVTREYFDLEFLRPESSDWEDDRDEAM
jgi:hypothetical protein